MNVKLKNKGYSYGDRDIVKVSFPDGRVQPFYKSSGRNSGMPETWFPFDGISYPSMGMLEWFDKTKYCFSSNPKGVVMEMDRHGTYEFKKVGEWLSEQDIPKGKQTCPFEIDEWLGYDNDTVQFARENRQ
jgi:hypothetical protein